MIRLYGNLKVKRIVAWLILVSTVLTTFITSTTETVYADSNSRRRTSINLAAGIGFGDITNFDDIDEVSLQTIAVYLSNFYLPFITILDGDYTKENAEDSGNTQHVEAMKNALIRNCGFKKDVAEYLVAYVLNQSLASCKALYMKTSELKTCFTLCTNPVDDFGLLGIPTELEYVVGTRSFLGFSTSGYLYNANAHDGLGTWAASWRDSSIFYLLNTDVDDDGEPERYPYIEKVGKVRVDGEDYTPISYAIFRGVMMNLCTDAEGNISELGDFNFYTLRADDTGKVSAVKVFDNSYASTLACLQAWQYSDIEHGYGTGFMSITPTDVESIDDPEITQYALVTCPNMYVNWEGSLIFDNGVYRTVVLPGCMNPVMVQAAKNWHAGSKSGQTFTFTNDNGTWTTSTNPAETSWGSGINLINNTSLSTIGTGNSTWDAPTTFYSKAYKNYCIVTGSSGWNFDQSWWPWSGWGDNENIFDLLESIAYADVNARDGDDYARIPSLSERLYLSEIIDYTNTDPRYLNIKLWGLTSSFFDLLNGEVTYDWYVDYVATHITWLDSFKAVTASDDLTAFFPLQDVTDPDFMKSLQNFNIDTYAQFKNIKKQGHALEYPKSTQKLFQNIYLTYCFGAFNSDSDNFKYDYNIVPIKLNLKSFPEANVDIDWTSIQQDQLGLEVMSFIYYLLHPTEGIAYVTRLFKNKVSGILLGWHEDIVGATSSNAATGMTKYLGTSSYTTTPNLKDISWVAGLVNIYNNIVVYLIILMCLILLCYVLTGSMTIQRGIVGLLLFGLCAFLPPVAINTAVDTINNVSDSVFSKKFDYWAICQLQNFVDDYKAAMDAQAEGNFGSYAAFVLANTAQDISPIDSDDEASAATYSGAKLKWMAPKKYNSLASLVQAVNEGTAMGNSSAVFLRNTVLNIVAKSTSGETFLSDTDSLYLYRDYADIFKYSHAPYNMFSTFNFKGDLGSGANDPMWAMHNSPLAVFINTSFDTSSYRRAWEGMEDLVAYEFVRENDINVLNETAESETSSIYAASKGYLYNTLPELPSGTDKLTYLYNYSGDPINLWNNTLAVSYLANYTRTVREVHDAHIRLQAVVDGSESVNAARPTSQYYNFGLPKATVKSKYQTGSYLWGYQEIIGLKDASLPHDKKEEVKEAYKNISDVFYGLYSESPYFYFNANIRDQANATELESGYAYDFSTLNRNKQPGTDGKMNSIAKMFLMNNQEYFFNLVPTAGDGYGELRDFTNMHDFFYFVIPYLREGVELARLYDSTFGLYTDDDCSLVVNADGSCLYDGKTFQDLKELQELLSSGDYNEEELYKLWHSYNTYTILSAYTPWIDTMLDCNYHKPETIVVMGEKFRVTDPINPRTYYETDASGKVIAGRYMVFSLSEMNAMGLTTADLTTVERKIIQFQENVYSKTLDLMNYYTFSDEVMIQAYAMLQTFEFNKLFSQTSLFGEDYVMYPQGYELKAFSYDAYLRMIVSGASGETLMFNSKDQEGNVSIYSRVMKNTSLFFGIFLLLNDLLAVYVIPGLKVFFLVTIFICSILILLSAVIKMEMNILQVLWKSLFAPLLSFSAICIGLSLIVSMFMKTGANGVTSTEFFISMGDPTSAIIVQIILNAGVVILLFKICKKCFKDLITYGKAVFDNMGSAVVGAVGAIGAGFAAGNVMSRIRGGSGSGSGISRTAKQRGKDNDPRSGKSGVGTALAGGVAGGALGAGLAAGGNPAADGNYEALDSEAKRRANAAQDRADATRGMNKYDKKAFEGANAKHDAAQDKAKRNEELAANATGLRKKRFEMAQKWNQRKANSAEIKADNVKKYGNGLKGKAIGLTTVFGKGRKTRLDGIRADATERQKKRETSATDARAKRNAEVAKANASAMKEAGIGQSNSLSLTQVNINVGKRAGGKQKKGGATSSGKQPRNKNKLPPASSRKKAKRSVKK